jgi:hypothetical protein
MTQRVLTDVQVSKVIDFLKRWGIDSPELVFELTDHYCEKAKDQMKQGWSFEKVLDSWKTKKHFRELKSIQTEFESIVNKKWWRAHLSAVKKLFLSKQVFLYTAVLSIMYLCYQFDLGAVFSTLALIAAVFAWFAMVYLYWFRRYGWFFQTRDLTVMVMGCWFIVYEFISKGGYRSVFEGNSFELSMISLSVSITCGFIGYNLFTSVNRELKLITSEYISEPEKFQRR